jgi:hypothetical protein
MRIATLSSWINIQEYEKSHWSSVRSQDQREKEEGSTILRIGVGGLEEGWEGGYINVMIYSINLCKSTTYELRISFLLSQFLA